MRFFIPTAIFHPESGGPATYLYRFVPELIKRGHNVQVLTFGAGPAKESERYGYPVTRVPLIRGLPGLITRRAAYLDHYRRYAADADLSYINNLGLPRPRTEPRRRLLKVVGDYAWERAVNRGWVAPDTDIDDFQKKRYSPLVEALKWGRAREVRTVDRVIVPSDYLRRMVIGWGAPPDRVRVIYNALENEPESGTPWMIEARTRLGIPADDSILLTAARLTAWKGVDYLLEAVAAVPKVRLFIAGDGPQRSALEAQAERLKLGERAIFLGKVPREEMPLFMRAADYFALYSGYEGLAHVLLEALSVGTPVIASDRGGNPEVVTHDQNGLLVKHPDRAALINAITEAFKPGVRDRLATDVVAGRGTLEDRFAWSRLVRETITLLENMAGVQQ